MLIPSYTKDFFGSPWVCSVGNKCNRVKGHGKIYSNDVLKINSTTKIIGIEKNKVHPIGNRQIMLLSKFKVKLVFKVQKQSFADISKNTRS